MENKMADVAKLLGVDLGEEFEICQNAGFIYRFTENNFEFKSPTTWWGTASSPIFFNLLKGFYTIKKKPWMPHDGEMYYIPNESNDSRVEDYNWEADELDYRFFESGLVCRTKEEAIELADEFVKMARKMRGMDDENS